MSIESRSKQYGAVFGDWHIGKKIGGGSNGQSAVFELYRNHDGWQERSALKVISLIEEPGNLADMSQNRRNEYSTASQYRRSVAEQEVRLMDQVRGKTNIVDYLDHKFFEWTDEEGFGADMLIRMEMLTDLRSQIRNDRSFTQQEVIQIARDICRGLAICHEKGILHRDIKPENIFVNGDGDYKLGDFGVSRMMKSSASSMASTNIGTPAYAAPEQAHGQYDHRVDIYSLGLVLYELCNGNKLPFAETSYLTEADVQLRLAGKPLPTPEGCSQELTQIILKACAYKPEDRYQTARELLEELNHLDNNNFAPPALENVNYGTQKVTPAKDLNATQYAYGNTANTNTRPQAPQQPEPKKKKTGPLLLALAGIALIIALVVILSQTGHQHIWALASCTDARTCEICGETQGSALGHQWKEATCSAPRTCQRCGVTVGSALGHQWKEATYEAPRTCAVCGVTEGGVLARKWVYINELNYFAHNGKVWTMSKEAPSFDADPDFSDIKAHQNESKPGHITGPVYDHLGNYYTYGLSVDGVDYEAYDVTYYVGGEYDTFSGYISMTPDVRNDEHADQGKYFEVYGDGKRLYVSPIMTKYRNSALSFTVNISGVKQLTIRYPMTSGPSRMATIFDGKLSAD